MRKRGLLRRKLTAFFVGFLLVILLLFFFWSKIKGIESVIILRSIYLVDKITFFIILIMTVFSLILAKELIDIYILRRNIGQRGKMLRRSTSVDED